MRRILTTTIAVAAMAAAADTDWPTFRGLYENGVAKGDAPLTWSDTENVKWKLDIPGKGNSSPVIWGDRIFLTTAIPIEEPPKVEPPPEPPPEASGRRRRRRPPMPLVKHQFVLMALDKTDGKLLWKKVARTATPHEGHHRNYGSFASNSPVTDGEHVIAFFGSRGVYCYDLDGQLIWEKDFGVNMEMAGTFGEGVAPRLHGDVLVLTFDHQGDSFIVALDKNNGKELWRKARDERSAWSQPLVIEREGREEVVVSASNRVRSYNLETGELIWECGGLGSNVIPNPIYDSEADLLLVMSGHRDPMLLAIQLGETGDLTGTDAIVWTNDRGNSYTPSPVYHEGRFYFLSDRGMISCFDAKTGEAHYHQQRLPGPYNFKASPVAAGGKLYLSSENEDVIVLKLGPEYEVLATNKMTDQMFIATPAISGGEMFLRSTTTLYCIKP